MKRKIEIKDIISEIKKITGKKKIKLENDTNFLKLNYLDSFGYVELATVLEKKYKKKNNHVKFFNYKNANLKSILKILNE